MGKRAKSKSIEDLKNHIFKKIFPLFLDADKEELERAFKSKNLSAVNKALGISNKELQVILGEGQMLAFKAFADFLKQKNLIDTLKEFIKERSQKAAR